MFGIGMGTLFALFGVMLFGAHEPAGLVCVILGFVSVFTGMANQQDQKRLKSGQLKELGMGNDAVQAFQQADDEQRAAEVMRAQTLPVLPAAFPYPMLPGEYACYRNQATFTEARQTPRLGGGYMAWDSYPVATDQGELYVTTRRLLFSGPREPREVPLTDISSLRTGPGVLEIQRRGRPCPILIGVQYPAELAAYIERARGASPGSLPGAQAPYALGAPAANNSGAVNPGTANPAAESVTGATLNKTGRQASSAPSFILCSGCGAANGLSANFCQNCAAPISPGSTPTLVHKPELG